MQLRSSKKRTAAETGRNALFADTSLDQDKSNSANINDSGAVDQGKEMHTLIMAKHENEEDNIAKGEDEALTDNLAKGEESKNTLSKLMEKEEDQALEDKQVLNQDPADSEDSETEYIAKGEEEDVKAQQALLTHAAIQQEENQELEGQQAQTKTLVYEDNQDEEMDAEQEKNTIFIKGEETKADQFEDVMDVDKCDETEETGMNNQEAMDVEEATDIASVTINNHAENATLLRISMKNNARIVIRQNEHDGLAYKAPEPVSRDQSEEEDLEINIKKEAKKNQMYHWRNIPNTPTSVANALDKRTLSWHCWSILKLITNSITRVERYGKCTWNPTSMIPNSTAVLARKDLSNGSKIP